MGPDVRLWRASGLARFVVCNSYRRIKNKGAETVAGALARFPEEFSKSPWSTPPATVVSFGYAHFKTA
jgi:hypothetical protein